MMIFSEKVYDIVKYICVIGLPAVSTFILGLGQIFDLTWAEPCSLILILIQALLGTLFCIDVAGYNANELAAASALANEDENEDE